MTSAPQPAPREYSRAGWFTLILLIVTCVGDGWTGRPSPLAHQFLLLPLTLTFLYGAWELLSPSARLFLPSWSPIRALQLALLFQSLTVALYFYEGRHFSALGYHVHPFLASAIFVPLLVLLGIAATGRLKSAAIFATSIAAYAGIIFLAVAGFPLNYLRSDMLAVILWADQALLHHLSPYATQYVGGRVYDFPYLPGMILGSLPFTAAHLDIRFGSLVYIAGTAALLYCSAKRDRRLEVAALIALFVLCPFLQYRHELYLQPHWFVLTLAIVLAQRRNFGWAAFVFGASMGIYQFSWILFPFVGLNGWRRGGGREAGRVVMLGVVGMLVVVGPFLRSASQRMASNTVGQWRLLPHAMADPMNLSYWATYLIRPDKLLRLQALLMVGIFGYCFFRGKCGDLADTLRWMTVALTVFVMFNVIVDGYFYLMILLVMLAYTCVANGWLAEPVAEGG